MAEARRVTVAERRARAAGRLLAADCAGGEDVVRRLVALHATDPATVYLSVAARLAEPAGAVIGLDEALYGERPTLARMLAMRRTMFVVARDEAPRVYAAAGRPVAVKLRKDLLGFLAEGGGWDARWLAEVEAEVAAALRAHPDSSGAQLSKLVPRLREQVVVARGKPYEATQNVASRIIRTLAAEGRIERRRPMGTWTSGQFRWSNAEPLAEEPAEPARAVLAADWLAAYGPGTEDDLKWWTGWSLTHVRKALAEAGAEPVGLDGGDTGYVLPGDEAPPPVAPRAVLLPALDPVPMGWRDRSWFLPPAHADLFDRSGNIAPTVWWGGEIVGGWAQRADGTVVWRSLTDRGTEAAAAVDAAAARLTDWLGPIRVTPRFRTPLDKALTA